jgi:hypothetical protein
MRTRFAGALIAALVSTSLAACGDSDKPAVCASANDLGTAVADLNDVDLTSDGAVGDLQEKLGTVSSDFEQLKSDAKSQFSSQIDAVDTDVATLKTSVDTAGADRTAANVAAVVAAASAVVSSAKALVSDVESTC